MRNYKILPYLQKTGIHVIKYIFPTEIVDTVLKPVSETPHEDTQFFLKEKLNPISAKEGHVKMADTCFATIQQNFASPMVYKTTILGIKSAQIFNDLVISNVVDNEKSNCTNY